MIKNDLDKVLLFRRIIRRTSNNSPLPFVTSRADKSRQLTRETAPILFRNVDSSSWQELNGSAKFHSARERETARKRNGGRRG